MHYGDVIMDAIASQITSLTIVYSIVYSDADQRKHQSSASLAFVQRIHRGPVNSPHKWPVTRKMFPFDDVIMDRCRMNVMASQITSNSIVSIAPPCPKKQSSLSLTLCGGNAQAAGGSPSQRTSIAESDHMTIWSLYWESLYLKILLWYKPHGHIPQTHGVHPPHAFNVLRTTSSPAASFSCV